MSFLPFYKDWHYDIKWVFYRILPVTSVNVTRQKFVLVIVLIRNWHEWYERETARMCWYLTLKTETKRYRANYCALKYLQTAQCLLAGKMSKTYFSIQINLDLPGRFNTANKRCTHFNLWTNISYITFIFNPHTLCYGPTALSRYMSRADRNKILALIRFRLWMHEFLGIPILNG
jgi:hypothetical protein